jgi:MoaA/NifB/PqqE/SkfB family radical SAM enzyme
MVQTTTLNLIAMVPVTPKYYTGLSKWLIEQEIKLITLFYFSGQLLKGIIRPRQYYHVLRRLLFFLSQMHHNKYVKIGKRIKINLYVPGFPSKAFFTACKKVLSFDSTFPCITALISISSACRYDCPHCYQKFDKGKDVAIASLIEVVQKLQDKGIAFFNIEGGEPFLRFDRLMAVCNAIDERSEILINSTGDGMTREKLMELRKIHNLMGIMFSLHTSTPSQLNEFTRSDNAWNNLEQGIQLCHEAGIPVAFNSCLLKEAYTNGTFEKILKKATQFKGSIIQLIKPKPAGGWLNETITPFTKTDIQTILEKVDRFNLKRRNKNTVAIYAMIREESEQFFGCTSGGIDRFYINAKGDLQPCEFLNISFGNIMTDNFDEIYDKMREVFNKPTSYMMCERYANQVAALKKKHGIESLPLPPDVSHELYANWQRDGSVDFYQQLQQL